jgi:hypothetical protein
MTRLALFLLFVLAAISVSIGFKARAAGNPISGPTVAEFGSEVAILGDGTPMFAPLGTVARQLADWLGNPKSTEQYFEVGGAQFRPNAVEPLPEAEARLRRLATLLQAYPKVEARIVGYAAPSGNDAADAVLARERSLDVMEMLVADGIRRSRLAVAEPSAEPSEDLRRGIWPDRIGIILKYPKRVATPSS